MKKRILVALKSWKNIYIEKNILKNPTEMEPKPKNKINQKESIPVPKCRREFLKPDPGQTLEEW